MPVFGALAIAFTAASVIKSYSSAQKAAGDAKSAAASSAAAQRLISERNATTVENVAAANAAAGNAVADYNARVALSEEQQVALDSSESVRNMRRDASVYLSRQRSAFAGSGIRADTGSPLALQVSTAGRLALREAEAHRVANARITGMGAVARTGVLEAKTRGDLSLYEARQRAELIRLEGGAGATAAEIEGQARSDAYKSSATATVLSGAAKMLSMGYGLGQSTGVSGGGSSSIQPTAKNTFDFSGPITTGGYA